MASVGRTLLFIVVMMVLIFLSLSLVPNLSKLNIVPERPKPFISSPSDCSKLNGSLAYECITKYAVEQKSDSLCEMIKVSYYRDECYSKANEGQPERICERLTLSGKRSACFLEIALANKNRDECAKAAAPGSGGDEASDDCFLAYSIRAQDRESCSRILGPVKGGDCLFRFVSRNNESECDSASKEATQYCRLSVVVSNGDSSSCSQFQETLRDQCYLDISYATQKPSLCGLISDPELSRACMNSTG